MDIIFLVPVAVLCATLILCLTCWLFSVILKAFNFCLIAHLFEVISLIIACFLILAGVIILIIFAFLTVISAFVFF